MRKNGFTLIELLIALSIAALLLVLAAPLYGQWVADNQIRNGAQLIADGMRLAQGIAVKRNAQVELVLDPTTKTGGWKVQFPGQSSLQEGLFVDGADRVAFAVLPAGLNTVTFTGMGTIAPLNADGSAPMEQIEISSSVSGTRKLRVLVGGAAGSARTGVKICDPAWPATDPKGCPAAAAGGT
jgi:prepilin-type N-terminal cleavage/methylation domain-containing protein